MATSSTCRASYFQRVRYRRPADVTEHMLLRHIVVRWVRAEDDLGKERT
jgi:hypothetical protein